MHASGTGGQAREGEPPKCIAPPGAACRTASPDASPARGSSTRAPNELDDNLTTPILPPLLPISLATTMSLMYGSNKAGGDKPQLDVGRSPPLLLSGELPRGAGLTLLPDLPLRRPPRRLDERAGLPQVSLALAGSPRGLGPAV